LTGKPYKHALAWILSNRGVKIEDFVHEYYSVVRFKATYEDRIESILDRSQWPVVELGFKVYPPLLGRGAGRPKVQRQEVAWRKGHPKRWSNVGDVEILATFQKLANWQRLEKMVRELH